MTLQKTDAALGGRIAVRSKSLALEARFLTLCGVVALVLSGCASKPLSTRPDLTVLPAGEVLPPPGRADMVAPEREFLIGPFDKMQVDVFALPELSRSVQVDAGGNVSLPLVGVLRASGRTPAELSSLYASGLQRRYVRSPKVTVNMLETVSQNVAVGGAVGSPGVYPVVGKMTLLRALARASGITEFGKEHEVVVYRRVNNHDMAALYDVAAIRKGAYADPEIYANDVVEVGESRGRRIFKDFVGIAPILSAPIIALLN